VPAGKSDQGLVDAERAMDGIPMTGRMIDTDRHNRIMEEKLESLALANPELAEASMKRSELGQKFEATKNRKFD
jgi:hypothetical protein